MDAAILRLKGDLKSPPGTRMHRRHRIRLSSHNTRGRREAWAGCDTYRPYSQALRHPATLRRRPEREAGMRCISSVFFHHHVEKWWVAGADTDLVTTEVAG